MPGLANCPYWYFGSNQKLYCLTGLKICSMAGNSCGAVNHSQIYTAGVVIGFRPKLTFVTSSHQCNCLLYTKTYVFVFTPHHSSKKLFLCNRWRPLQSSTTAQMQRLCIHEMSKPKRHIYNTTSTPKTQGAEEQGQREY